MGLYTQINTSKLNKYTQNKNKTTFGISCVDTNIYNIFNDNIMHTYLNNKIIRRS